MPSCPRQAETKSRPARPAFFLPTPPAPSEKRYSPPSARPLLAFLVLLGLISGSACSRIAPRRLSEAERRERINRLREAAETAGGSQVWIKAPRRASPASPPSFEVLATPDAYEAVTAAIERESKEQDLEIRVREKQGEGKYRVRELRLARDGGLVARWRLREVRQLRRAAIVIDDLGQDLEVARKLVRLRLPLTFSVLPHLPHSTEIAEEAHRTGGEVMLHLPMQPEPGAAAGPGSGEIKVGMRPSDLSRIIEEDLASVPFSAGVNNHMGSRATADPALMTSVMRIFAEHRLYFVDSRTTAASVALDCARRQGIPAFYRSVFLDDTETVAYALEKLREFRRLAEEQNVALAIGHPYPTTLEALAKFSPEFDRADIELVSASQLVRLPEVARLTPPRRAAR